MDKKIGKFFDSVGSFFSGSDGIPWCDHDVIVGCECDFVDAVTGSSDKAKHECLMRLSWVLVHSKRPADVHCGIAMLQASLADSKTPPGDEGKHLYLLAVGYYRNADYTRSRQLVDRCLQRVPDWRQALTLKKAIENRTTKDGAIGIGIVATAVGLVAGGIVVALYALKK